MNRTAGLIALSAVLAAPACAQELTLRDAAASRGFMAGAVVSYDTVRDGAYRELLKRDFNSLTAANEFKAYSLVSQKLSRNSADGMPVMDYTRADAIMDFAAANGFRMRGHVLVWDAFMPDWFFREGYKKSGKLVDGGLMRERLRSYITSVITHFEEKYPGVIYCWDVVNEAVGDSSADYDAGDPRHVRTKRGGAANLFRSVIGPDYVELSFRYAREAADSAGADIKLFYNDYNTFYEDKRNAICALVESINSDGKFCDGVGMQAYIGGYGKQAGCMNPADIARVGESIRRYASLGCEVQLTELAVRNYRNDADTMRRHAEFCGNLFGMLSKVNTAENSPLTAVSVWGLVDDPDSDPASYGYRMNGPYCGIYDSGLNKKPEFYEIVAALSGEEK